MKEGGGQQQLEDQTNATIVTPASKTPTKKPSTTPASSSKPKTPVFERLYAEGREKVSRNRANAPSATPRKVSSSSRPASSPAGLYERGMQNKAALDLKKKEIEATHVPTFQPELFTKKKGGSRTNAALAAAHVPAWQRLYEQSAKKKTVKHDDHDEKSTSTRRKTSLGGRGETRIEHLYQNGLEKERSRRSWPKVSDE